MMARSPPTGPGLEAPPPPQEPRSTAASAKKTLPMRDLRIESSFTLFPLFSPRRLNLQKLAAYRGLLKRNFQFAASRSCQNPPRGAVAGYCCAATKIGSAWALARPNPRYRDRARRARGIPHHDIPGRERQGSGRALHIEQVAVGCPSNSDAAVVGEKLVRGLSYRIRGAAKHRVRHRLAALQRQRRRDHREPRGGAIGIQGIARQVNGDVRRVVAARDADRDGGGGRPARNAPDGDDPRRLRGRN